MSLYSRSPLLVWYFSRDALWSGAACVSAVWPGVSAIEGVWMGYTCKYHESFLGTPSCPNYPGTNLLLNKKQNFIFTSVLCLTYRTGVYFASCRVTCAFYQLNHQISDMYSSTNLFDLLERCFERRSFLRAHSSFDIHSVLRQSVSGSAHSNLFVLISNVVKCLIIWPYCLIERVG